MGRRSLRPVDLARIAGVSTQQIRNYADTGVLPPAPRTASGYRVFGEHHREALLAYRGLAQGYGWNVARSVMQAVHAGDVAEALALIDAAHAELHRQRLSLSATAEALRTVAAQSDAAGDGPGADSGALPGGRRGTGSADAPGAEPGTAMRGGLRIGEVAALLGVRASALRVWESAGLLIPSREPGTGYRRYGPADVRDARMVLILRQSRYPLPQIRPILDELRRSGGSDALGEALDRRRQALTRRSRAMLEGAALLHRYLGERDASGGAAVAEDQGTA